MKTEITHDESISFGKEIAKSFVKTTVETAAVWTGLGIVLFAFASILRRKQARETEPYQKPE